jgi:hypothetical protein
VAVSTQPCEDGAEIHLRRAGFHERQTVFHLFEVPDHDIGRLVLAARGPGKNRRVLFGRAAGCAGQFIEGDNERGARDQFAQDIGKHHITGKAGEQEMKLARQFDDAAAIIGGARFDLAGDVPAQPIHFRPGGGRREIPHDGGLDDAARRKHFARLAHRRLRYKGAAIRQQRH